MRLPIPPLPHSGRHCSIAYIEWQEVEGRLTSWHALRKGGKQECWDISNDADRKKKGVPHSVGLLIADKPALAGCSLLPVKIQMTPPVQLHTSLIRIKTKRSFFPVGNDLNLISVHTQV